MWYPGEHLPGEFTVTTHHWCCLTIMSGSTWNWNRICPCGWVSNQSKNLLLAVYQLQKNFSCLWIILVYWCFRQDWLWWNFWAKLVQRIVAVWAFAGWTKHRIFGTLWTDCVCIPLGRKGLKHENMPILWQPSSRSYGEQFNFKLQKLHEAHKKIDFKVTRNEH